MRIALLLAAPLIATLSYPADVRAAELHRIDTGDLQVEYSSSLDSNGARLFVGRDRISGKKFRLRLANGWVRGHVGGEPIVFHVSEVRRDELTSRDHPRRK